MGIVAFLRVSRSSRQYVSEQSRKTEASADRKLSRAQHDRICAVSMSSKSVRQGSTRRYDGRKGDLEKRKSETMERRRYGRKRQQ